MTKFLANLTMGKKVGGSLISILVLLTAVVLLSHLVLSGVGKRVNSVVHDIQPAVTASMQLNAQIERSASALGFYLLSKEAVHKDAYLAALKQVDDTLKKLSANRVVREDKTFGGLVAGIERDVKTFEGYRTRLLELAASDARNIPAIGYASQTLNPLSQQMLQNLSSMVQSESLEASTPKRKRILTDIEDLRYNWSNVMNGVRAFLAFRGRSSLNEVKLYNGECDRLAKKLRDYGDEGLTFDQSDSLDQFEKLRARFLKDFNHVLTLESSGKWRTDAYLVRTAIGPLMTDIEDNVKQLVVDLNKRAQDTSTSLTQEMQSSMLMEWILLAVGLVLGVALVVGSVLLIVRPVQRMRDLLKDISEGEGDLTQRCELNSGDELGQASRYFNEMMENLQHMVRDIATVSGEVHSRSQRANSEIEYVTANTNDSADRARSTATATEEMSATGAEIARSAAEAAEEAAAVQQVSQEGSRCVAQMSNKAKNMGVHVDDLRRDVIALGDKSKGMLDMVGIINAIANQTNLLALNAAIEAARAGEMGRGFAVVADEVRQLAMKTQESTSQITALISDNLQSNEQLAGVMEKVADVTQSMVDSVDETAQVITRMTGGVQVMNDKAGRIATASKEQSVATDEVAGNVESISAMESENSTRAAEISGHLSELSELSTRLDGLVARFKV